MDSILKQAKELQPRLLPLFEELHRHPELSFDEVRTTRFLRKVLEDLGLEILDLPVETGLAALLKGSGSGGLVGLRADLDAVVVQEHPDHNPCSETPGVMHACGHDYHMTCALGAAMLLSERKPGGDVALIFQPAEEITRGAAAMLEQGLLERLPGKMRALFALHAEPRLPAGQVISSRSYASAAKTNFRIRLTGTVGHSGSPQSYQDVIPAGAALIQGVQNLVSRQSDPQKALVCAIHTIQAGELEFFVTDQMVMSGTMRAFDEELLKGTIERLRKLVQGVAETYGCSGQVEIIPEVPAQLNHPDLYPAARQACLQIFGQENTMESEPLFMGAEDFALFGARIPSHFYWIGTGFPDRPNASQHQPAFQINPQAIPYGVALLVSSIRFMQDIIQGKE